MSQRDIKLFVQDMLVALERIDEYTRDISHADYFLEDRKTVDAVVRNLAILGEAATHIPEEIRKQYVGIPWDKIRGMRNKVVHEYFGVDTAILWQTLKEDLPPLHQLLEALLRDVS